MTEQTETENVNGRRVCTEAEGGPSRSVDSHGTVYPTFDNGFRMRDRGDVWS
jgi:hypothetical protein